MTVDSRWLWKQTWVNSQYNIR